MRREVGQVGDGDTFQDWFNNIPPITKVNRKLFCFFVPVVII